MEDNVDQSCPNVSSHRATKNYRHAICQKTFISLLKRQVSKDLDHDCEPLGKQGARGTLFKFTLVSHGYTFVAKGTVEAFVPDLRYESEIYGKLHKLQGEAVPVHLGSIDLRHCYFLDVGVQIVHMMFMSWAGEEVDEFGMTQAMLEQLKSSGAAAEPGASEEGVEEKGRPTKTRVSFTITGVCLSENALPNGSPGKRRKRRQARDVNEEDEEENESPIKTYVSSTTRVVPAEKALPNGSQGKGQKRHRICDVDDDEKENKERALKTRVAVTRASGPSQKCPPRRSGDR
ncbi:MAG: hypothetical protein M1817_004643 [Caeruleum heppii]|nr:MAG: hypothetical protein M1817_004643 [Caeruleum heppii]